MVLLFRLFLVGVLGFLYVLFILLLKNGKIVLMEIWSVILIILLIGWWLLGKFDVLSVKSFRLFWLLMFGFVVGVVVFNCSILDIWMLIGWLEKVLEVFVFVCDRLRVRFERNVVIMLICGNIWGFVKVFLVMIFSNLGSVGFVM